MSPDTGPDGKQRLWVSANLWGRELGKWTAAAWSPDTGTEGQLHLVRMSSSRSLLVVIED